MDQASRDNVTPCRFHGMATPWRRLSCPAVPQSVHRIARRRKDASPVQPPDPPGAYTARREDAARAKAFALAADEWKLADAIASRS